MAARRRTTSRTGAKGKKKLTKKNKRLLTIAAVAAGAYFLFLRKPGAAASAGANVNIQMEPAAVKANEKVSAETYRIIQARRGGMSYAQVSEGSPPSVLAFTSPKNGTFTRNFVQEGGALWAEIN